MACGIWNISPDLIGLALPTGFCAAMLAVTVGFRVSMYMGFFVAAMTAMMIGDQFDSAIGGMLLCGITSLAVRNADNYRSFFIRTMFAVIGSFIGGTAIILRLSTVPACRNFLGLGGRSQRFSDCDAGAAGLFVLECSSGSARICPPDVRLQSPLL